MSTYWYAVSDEQREYVFVVAQNRAPPERSAVADIVARVTTGPVVPEWVTSGDFRLVCDGAAEFERIQENYRDCDANDDELEEREQREVEGRE